MRVALVCFCLALIWVPIGTAHAQSTPDEQAARESACDAGIVAQCAAAARVFIGADPARAKRFLDRGCAGGDRRACGALGLMLVSGDQSDRDYARAAPLLAAACDEGMGAACGSLSNMLFLGVGVEQDHAAALTRADQGCAVHDARSCMAFGLHLSAGDVYPRDFRRAGPALREACAARESEACGMLENAASAVASGEQPGLERAAALDWFGAACQGGRPRACGVAGAFLSEGLFGPADPESGAAMFQRGCDLDHAMSCASLAEAFRSGRGVPRDAAQARAFAERALALEPGHEDALRTLRRLR
ncbi:MAG: hypothetical protein GC189_05140 [Alphaproteobacteria bacterium]|nr:hypothetical protein [Alphaproteobacteria bacterium]